MRPAAERESTKLCRERESTKLQREGVKPLQKKRIIDSHAAAVEEGE